MLFQKMCDILHDMLYPKLCIIGAKTRFFNGMKGCIPPMCGMQKKCRSHHIRGGKWLVKITICRKST